MIRIELFGAVRASVDGVEVENLSAKQRQLLALLASSAGAPVDRDQLVDRLWGGSPPRSHVSTLDSYVCTLRKALGQGAGPRSALATTSHGLVLRHDGRVAVDLLEFRELCRLAHVRAGRDGLELARRAVALAREDLMADLRGAEWTDRHRQDAARLLVDTATLAAQRANGFGDHHLAVELASVAVDHDALAETGWYQLVLAHWLGGGRARALSAYVDYREAMADGLGEAPCRESELLYLSILRTRSCEAAEERQEAAPRVRALLSLLRQELELVPGVRPPALDRELSEVAVRVLAGAAS